MQFQKESRHCTS